MKYQMREKLASIGDDSWVEDEHGNKVYKVDGKAFRMRDTFILQDAAGAEVAKIQERKLHVRDTMAIERGGKKIADVHKRLIGIRHRLKVDLEGGDAWTIKGNFTDHEYEIKGDRGTIARISKKWFRVRDTYGVDIAPDQDDPLILAVAVAVESLTEVVDR
jgi:uncharacterized protein YxjI